MTILAAREKPASVDGDTPAVPKPKKRQMDIDDDLAEEKEDEKEDESCEDPSEKDLIDLTSQKAKKTLDEEVCLVSFSIYLRD